MIERGKANLQMLSDIIGHEPFLHCDAIATVSASDMECLDFMALVDSLVAGIGLGGDGRRVVRPLVPPVSDDDSCDDADGEHDRNEERRDQRHCGARLAEDGLAGAEGEGPSRRKIGISHGEDDRPSERARARIACGKSMRADSCGLLAASRKQKDYAPAREQAGSERYHMACRFLIR